MTHLQANRYDCKKHRCAARQQDDKTFRHGGVCPGDKEAFQKACGLLDFDPDRPQVIPSALLDGSEPAEWTDIDGTEYCVVYTDGSCMSGIDRCLAEGGRGIVF